MRLDRVKGKYGKYGLIKVRRLEQIQAPEFAAAGVASGMLLSDVADAIRTLEAHGIIDWGDTPETEFFVIRLKDNNAAAALYHYAKSVFLDDAEYGRDVMDLAKRSGPMHPNCRKPD